jgi:hypothetical protein
MAVVGIAVDDEWVYQKIAKKLEEMGIPFVNLEKMPYDVKIVITDNMSKMNNKKILIKEKSKKGIERAVIECARKYRGNRRYNRVLIGIDPGPKPGIAIFGDESLLYGAELKDANVKNFIKDELAIYEHRCESCILRIGNGAAMYRNRIINSLIELTEKENMRIEIVDEKNTSREKSDVAAAKKIAFIEGREISGPFKIEIKKGEIKEIQKMSRMSDPGITISEDLAKEVAEGKLTIEKAIERMKKKE